MTMMHISTATEAGVTDHEEHIRKVRNPQSSLQFEIAAQLSAERMAAQKPFTAECSCPRTMKIDGIEYECLAPMGTGCVLHGERGERGYVLTRKPDARIVGRASGNSRRSK